MCGIYASNFTKKEEVVEKLKKINYRGPDNLSVKKINSLCLGHLRLSVIDLNERSNQPFQFDHLHLVYNGEIYNFKEVRSDLEEYGYFFKTDSDTEVILLAFHKWGRTFVNRLNGMFSLVIYDQNKNKIYAYRDRLGVKPLYYSFESGKFEIGSQISVLDNDKVIDQKALNAFLNTGYIPSPLSIFNKIKKLQPGHELIISFDSAKLEINKYWDLEKDPVLFKSNYKSIKKNLEILLEDCIKIRLNADVPFGAYLSGGIDSPIIAAIASKQVPTKLDTFTIGFKEKNYDESPIAKKYSEIINTNHYQKKISASDLLNILPDFLEVFDEPFADSSAIPSLALAKVTKNRVTVVLSGDGSDESFLGYNHFRNLFVVKIVFKIPYEIRKFLSKIIPFWLFKKASVLKKIFNLKDIDSFILETFSGGVNYLHQNLNHSYEYYSSYLNYSNNSFQKMADFGIKYWLENDSNVKVDRSSMFHSLEVRSPFSDYRLIEFSRKIPVRYRYFLGQRKIILKGILSKFIPKKLFKKPKKGFSVPLRYWINNQLKEEIKLSLNDDFLSSIPNFNKKIFNTYYKKHLNHKIDYSRHIWRLYVLYKWCKKNNVNLSK